MINKEMSPYMSSSTSSAPFPQVSATRTKTPMVETLPDDDPARTESPLSSIGAIRIDPPAWTTTDDIYCEADGLPFGSMEISPSPTFIAANDAIHAHLDTAAFATCTDQLHMLHDYKNFSETYSCPIRLLPATETSVTIPKGVGYLHISLLDDFNGIHVTQSSNHITTSYSKYISRVLRTH